MPHLDLPGYGPVELNLATGRYAGFDLATGIPVRITVGHPRFWRGPQLPSIQELAPVGGLFKINDRPTFEPAFRARLAETGVAALAKLVALQQQHPGETLVLCCYEDVHLPGEWCHRQIVGAWLSEQLGFDVPEVSVPGQGGVPKGMASGGNTHEAAARERKATAIASEARQGGITAAQLSGWRPGAWATLAKIAGQNLPSDKTKARVIEILTQAEKAPLRLVPDDPFDGLPQ